MNNFLYHILIIPISNLNNFFLYLVSDVLYLIVGKLIKYRKPLITKNLKNSFPEKNENEIKNIQRYFYKHFLDLIVESLKGFTISKKEINRKIKLKNPDLVNEMAQKSQNIILIGGHYNNWEMSAQKMPLECEHELFAIYKPLSNKFFDKKMKDSREKFGLRMISMKETKNYFQKNNEKPRAIIFGSDQSPSSTKNAHWLNFLNQESGFLFGAEKYAKEFNWPVVYVSIQKIQRGTYEVSFQLITDKPKEEPNGKIIQDFANLLEIDINRNPPYWLWTHNRWKKSK
ncbi:lysophospholipid acyltransferase family protein [Flavobacteriales bacterium]|nr:lysophospholipid acyltransferase family protein [Flavobacteriales bacterium]